MARKVRRKGNGDGRYKSAAVLTVFGAGRMTAKGRRDIAGWLREHAKFLLKHGAEYSERFRGRYLYR